MKFDYIVGNPPYQDDSEGENNTFAMPIYHIFLDAVYKLADKVEMIHPARFLFNVGSTPKEWNRKMLDDPHLKLMHYFPDSSTVFKDTDIMGGIAITYRDVTRKFEPIKIFTPSKELNSILKK